ncbi:MAG: Holliday junction branch migration protein RuvA, partial [Hyphomicrobiales bacterium]|nr:Holliday junction branch migration protein RuvA [Hyphomicrobiales bacterium]
MIGKLKGIVETVDDEELILDVGGVGYVVSASARTLRALPPAGQAATLHIEAQVREDAIRLFGFLTTAERDWFRLLQSVQGVGAKVALGILGALSGEALSAAIARQDKAMMARAPGVGPKLAARLVLELK